MTKSKIKNKNKISSILSIIASICFFITYFMTKETLNFIFAVVWLIIGLTYYAENKKQKNK